jgi:hypothetical protein
MVMVLDNETNDNVFLSLTKKSGWETMPIVLETSFFGVGDMKTCTIPRWFIRLFRGDEDYNGVVKCSVKTLTDKVRQGRSNEYKFTKDSWDVNNGALIEYVPDGTRGLGISCRVESPYAISYFGFQISEDGSSQAGHINI